MQTMLMMKKYADYLTLQSMWTIRDNATIGPQPLCNMTGRRVRDTERHRDRDITISCSVTMVTGMAIDIDMGMVFRRDTAMAIVFRRDTARAMVFRRETAMAIVY